MSQRSLLHSTELKALNLAFNKLTDVPKAVYALRALKSLKLTGNQIQHIDEAIGHLTDLEELVSGCSLCTKYKHAHTHTLA